MSRDESSSPAGPVTTAAPAAGLPTSLRLLCLSAAEPSWISLTLNLDAAACHQPQFRWCSTAAESLALLREESFDCVVVDARPAQRTSALAVLQGMRSAGSHDPVVWITDGVDDRDWIDLCRLDAEVLISPLAWESPALVAVVARAVGRGELLRNSHRLAVAQDRRTSRERDEAARLLLEQRQMIQDLTGLRDDHVLRTQTQGAPGRLAALPASVYDYYHELLRTYVIMGSGNLAAEIARLAELVGTAGLAPREVLHLHLARVENLVRGLGNRSTRHVMARADLLALELMMHLGEFYRARCDGVRG